MNRNIKISLALLALVAFIAWVYVYAFHSKHRTIADEQATAEFQAPELLYAFTSQDANLTSYADQVILVSGNVTSTDENSIVLNGMVQVNLLPTVETPIQTGESITLKGRCVGYDDLLEVVKIDQATILTQ